MNALCWNCRGMGNPSSVRQLRRWSTFYAPDIIFLSDAMLKKNDAEALKNKIGFVNGFGVSSQGRAGGLCLYWKDNVTFSLISYSQHHICGDVGEGSGSWRFVGLYGWAKEEEKYKTWELICHICDTTNIPLLIGGDFNEILSYDEKEGGANRVRREMTAFRDTLDDCALRDLGYTGMWYTWERGLSAAKCVRERLDRYVCTADWLHMFPTCSVEHGIRYKSDHVIIFMRGRQAGRQNHKQRGFRFETCWLLDESCEGVVKSAWDTSMGDGLPSRLSALGQNLRSWSATHFHNIGKQIKKAEEALSKVQHRDIYDANNK